MIAGTVHRGLATTLAALVVMSGIGGSAGGLPARIARADPGITRNQIVIGTPDVLTGFGANAFKNLAAAREAYFDEVNDNGGINGRKIKSMSADAGTLDPGLSALAVGTLKDEAFVLAATDGTIFGPLAQRYKIPFFYPFGTEKAGLHNAYGFPVGTYQAYQARELLPDYLLSELDAKEKKIAVVYEAETYLGEANAAFVKAAKKKGLNVVIDQPIEPLQPGCAQEVANVAAKKPDIVIPIVLLGSICLFREAQAQGLRTTWAGIGGTWGSNFFLGLAPGYLNGATLFGIYPTLETPCAQEYRKIMVKQRPDQPELLNDEPAFAAYLVYRNLVAQLEQAGRNLTRKRLLEKLSAVKNFDDGCLPPLTYGPGNKRRGGSSVSVWTAQNDKWLMKDPEYRTSFGSGAV